VRYDALVDLCITFAAPDRKFPNDHKVILTYRDDEGDMITIGSSDDLLEAMDQFSDILRLTVEVKKEVHREEYIHQPDVKSRPLTIDRHNSRPVPPFIHGRHTCDFCLMTPIVARRYHAINVPDHDLCETCYSHYDGTSIRFEPAELERDRCFQKQARIDMRCSHDQFILF